MQRLERLAAQAELSGAPDEPRLDARQAALRPPLRCDACDRPRGNPLALPLQLELQPLAPLEQAPDRAMRRVVDEDGARRGRRLQPRRDVHGVAKGCVLDPRTGADLPHHDGAGRGSHPDAEALDPPATPHLARVLLHLADDAERAADAPLGVVLPRGRRAEEGEDAVAGEILDVASERLHLADDPRYRLPDDELDVLEIEPLGERGRADDVGEDGRKDLPLLPHGSGHEQRLADAGAGFKAWSSTPSSGVRRERCVDQWLGVGM